ncbi:MAG: hypothetical protein HKL99_09760 [Burkholderiales bacterium]|jgi:hypothetical protein|nr:hypothetical protein [Burkholderiales bacterium]
MSALPSFAQMVRIYDLCARGLSIEAIALHLGLDVAQIREVLNPITRPEGGNPHD